MTHPPPDATSTPVTDVTSAAREVGEVHSTTDEAGSEVDALRQQVAALQVALATRPLIDQARGMLMQRYVIDADAALQVLVRLSVTANVKVRVIAEGIVKLFGGVPHLPEPAAAITEIITRLWERELPQPSEAPAATDRAFALPAHTSSAYGSEAGIALSCVTVLPGAGHDVVALTGELDLSTAPQMSRVIQGFLAQGRNRIIMNLDGVTFMDASALSALVIAHREIRRSHGTLVISHNPVCARLLAMTGLATLFKT
ncbi:anti-sigma factor antagonist [Nocardioides mesophilus]|uniref:Anti-sigma factor antagonist n=1 Tax=Nocardioides mesophilus TaxID=433659 RepID=A0A7G9R931_9ACTN|nr:anti-sigma factor antagonist [Nocardioides mesophilus]QNN52106.1 anti-sigma factor antagonist [Nocardioides mesophilus]